MSFGIGRSLASSAVALLAFSTCSCKHGGDENDGEASGESTAAESGDGPATGLLACPAGEACTIVVVAEALDDRVEFFSARGAGPVYRGAIDFDLKPNPMGDNEGENLDEPFGMAVTDQGLAALLGHYPMRHAGSLVVVPHELLAMVADGSTMSSSSFFAGGTFSAGVTDIAFGDEEPIFVRAHPSGRLLVGVFANDLFALETEWTNPGKLLVVDPATGEFAARTFDMIDGGSCEGAWSVVPLDASMNKVGLACDGNEGAVILDVSGVGDGSVADAAAAIDGCLADIPFPDRRVRYVAPDGEGGILVTDNSPIADFVDGHLYHYDADCKPLGDGPIPGPLWEAREIVRVPNDAGARWLLPTGRTPGRGVHVVQLDGDDPAICNKLDALEPSWVGTPDDIEVHPYALAVTRSGDGLAIGAGPVEPLKDMPGYGRVLWVDLDTSADPCDPGSGFIVNVIDLTASAPAVSVDDPSTWRRGPNQVFIQQYG